MKPISDTVHITIYLERELKNELKSKLAREGKTMSNFFVKKAKEEVKR